MPSAFYLGHVLSALQYERQNIIFLKVYDLHPKSGHLCEFQSSQSKE